ncbi:hypothetical protein ACCQ08_08730 [Comamonas sp. SY3]|uniref:hypothetical protein n=1 Tax=Comamonas sp. SY3 TaxID=3243601 RepID=UPI0035941ACD
MKNVNWHLFQATCTLLAPQLTNVPTQKALADETARRFRNLYFSLHEIAQEIESEVASGETIIPPISED